MDKQTSIVEIFCSLQGEGLSIGELHTFVRFQDCELTCTFCDTPQTFVSNKSCRVENKPLSKSFTFFENPISIETLNKILTSFKTPTLSITGGEPLQKVDFLKTWLPTIRKQYASILLETAGVHTEALLEILDHIDIVSMDFKLPSATGMKPYWKEHHRFLEASQEKEHYVKIIVSSHTTKDELQICSDILHTVNPRTPVILQPITAFAECRNVPSLTDLFEWQSFLLQRLENVRILPQLHKLLKIL